MGEESLSPGDRSMRELGHTHGKKFRREAGITYTEAFGELARDFTRSDRQKTMSAQQHSLTARGAGAVEYRPDYAVFRVGCAANE
jgi:hypothetical protein